LHRGERRQRNIFLDQHGNSYSLYMRPFRMQIMDVLPAMVSGSKPCPVRNAIW
jgi:hypothetical protein